MKKLFKFFIPVVALAAYSCATDMTEDLGVELGGGRTVIEVSLDGSRTYIAEAVGDKYPVYWSADDQISVNGVASNPLTEGGSASASFEFGKTLEIPYCVAYPAAPKGQVLFAATQTHTDGTFGDGVATMYGYSKNGLGLTLNHLTGVLKIGVTGEATLAKVQISTIDRAPIAGAFGIDFTSGKLTPTAESVDVIEYSFGYIEESQEGGVSLLPEEPTYLHVVVPAGVYNELYVTLYDTDGGVMYATVKATDEKPLTAGNVRKFSNTITYTANTDVFVIKDVESLQAFAAQASESSQDAVMVADINMTGKEWTPINGYSGVFRGNGYAIKGLTAPLFGETQARAIVGVHLEDVNINASEEIGVVGSSYVHIGAVACWLSNSTDSAIMNCSASGSITLTCSNTETPLTPFIGGILGRTSSDSENSNLLNDVDIKITGTYPGLIAGGVVGGAAAGQLTNCTNLGTITIEGVVGGNTAVGGIARYAGAMTNCVNGSPDDTTGEMGKIVMNCTSHEAAPCIGGLVENLSGDIYDCHNYGNIYYQSKAATSYALIGGLVRYYKSGSETLEKCSNHGDITVSGASDVSLIAGGFTAYQASDILYSNCHNYGNITFTADADAPAIYSGGMVGTNDRASGIARIQNCSNHGDIKVYTTKATTLCLGGVNGRIDEGQTLIGIADNAEMKSYNYGDILYEAASESASIYAGGCVGLLSNKSSSSTALRIAHFTNEGDITINGSCHTTHIGGLLGRFAKGVNTEKLYYTLTDSCNKGDLSVSATVKTGACAIGGLAGYLIHTYSGAHGNWINEGTLTFTGEVVTDRLLVGGYLGATDKALSGKSCTVYNFGDIVCTGKINSAKNNRVGGIFGQINQTFANCHCYCNITFDNTYSGMLTGAARGTSRPIGSNCSVGGTINGTTITQDNYFEHLYGGTTNWSGVEDYNGCTFLTVKPTL